MGWLKKLKKMEFQNFGDRNPGFCWFVFGKTARLNEESPENGAGQNFQRLMERKRVTGCYCYMDKQYDGARSRFREPQGMNTFFAKQSLPLFFLLSLSSAWAQTCPMPINPAEDFVANFYQNSGAQACYGTHMSSTNGVNATGDPNAVYSQTMYTVAPGYELVILGYFPNSRFLSATLYDNHLTTTPANYAFDYQFPPLFSNMVNPYLPNTPFKPQQMYGFTVTFGGTWGTIAPGCGTTTTFGNIVFDATQLHSGYTWNGAIYPAPPAPFPAHVTGPNQGGILQIRDYLDFGYTKQKTIPSPPVVIVRELSDGCAITAAAAISANNPTGQPILSVTNQLTVQNAALPWLDQGQIAAHREYYGTAAITPTQSFGTDSSYGQQAQWVRSSDWVGRNNTAAAYISTMLPQNDLTNFLNGTDVMRIRFQLPTTMPAPPCNPTNDTCAFTGNEAMRYFSLEFMTTTLSTFVPPSTVQAGEGDVLWALDDQAFVKSPSGAVTLVVGLSATPPAGVTAMNGYTYFNLTPYLGTEAPGFNSLLIRNLLANSSFTCSTNNVPNYTTEWNTNMGYMGPYVPTVDFLPTGTVFTAAHSPGRANTCATPETAVPVPDFTFVRTPV